MTRAERFTDVVTDHGEGVGWDIADGVLRCVDMLAGDLLTLSPCGSVVERRHLDRVAAAWRPRRGGGLVVAVERRFMLIDPDGRETRRAELWSDPGVRMNEGACDPEGRFWCGSMGYHAEPGAGRMWRLAADGTGELVEGPVTIPNGLVWSADGETAFHIDTPTGGIDAVSYSDGELGDRRLFARVEGGDPDGMTMDAEGGLWVALWGGSAVHRYDTDGQLDAVIEVDARQVSAVAFGGPDLDQLYITTSRTGLDEGEDPAAGSLFVADPGVLGVPLRPFAG